MTPFDEVLGRLGVVPVVVIHDPLRAAPLARALADGGLPCAEITFRTSGAADAMRRIAAEVPEVLLGAGTVLTPGQAAAAKEAGAQFVVSPGFNPRVVDYCQAHGLPVYPGVCTPTEIQSALEKGLEVLKFFPAGAVGRSTLPEVDLGALPRPQVHPHRGSQTRAPSRLPEARSGVGLWRLLARAGGLDRRGCLRSHP